MNAILPLAYNPGSVAPFYICTRHQLILTIVRLMMLGRHTKRTELHSRRRKPIFKPWQHLTLCTPDPHRKSGFGRVWKFGTVRWCYLSWVFLSTSLTTSWTALDYWRSFVERTYYYLIYQGIQGHSVLQPGRESDCYFYFWLPPMLRYPVQ